MGDYSSDFTIHNKLEIDLAVSQNGAPEDGYWKRWSTFVDPFSKSNPFQLKDSWGPEGTEGKIWITGKRPDTGKEFTIGLHMQCPTLSKNSVELWVESDQPNLLITAGPVMRDGHPFVFEVIIDRSI